MRSSPQPHTDYVLLICLLLLASLAFWNSGNHYRSIPLARREEEIMNGHGGPEDRMERPEEAKLCLLSLDGGGVRCLSAVRILRRVMAGINEDRRPKDRLRPCQVFDLIGGSGTGGLLAVLIGTLGMDIDEVQDIWLRVLGVLFGDMSLAQNQPSDTKELMGTIEPICDTKLLKQILVAVFKEKNIDPHRKFNDGQKIGKCHTFVSATWMVNSEVSLFRDYSRPGIEDQNKMENPTILEACMATLATLGFFEPATIGEAKYIDSEYGASNPIYHVWSEAEYLWKAYDAQEFDKKLHCIISIGTGTLPTVRVHTHWLPFYGNTLTKIARAADETDRTFRRMFPHLTEPTVMRFFRWSVQGLTAEVSFEEFRHLATLNALTDHYMGDQKRIWAFRRATKLMVQKDPMPHDIVDQEEAETQFA